MKSLLTLALACSVCMLAAAQPAERPRIYGLAFVGFRVSDLQRADVFYRRVLDLTPAGGQECRAYNVGSRQRVFIEPGLRPDQDDRLVTVGLITEDLPRLEAYLRASGLDPEYGTRCRRNVLRVTDPEGHVLEFEGPSPPHDGRSPMRILHAGITVADLPRMEAFYAKLLGFSEIWRGGSSDQVVDWINMKVPDGTEYLEFMLTGGRPLTRQRLGSMHHVALRVDDMQRAYEGVLERVPKDGRAGVGSPRIGRNRRWQLNLFDPDGSRTELMEPYPTR